MKFSMTEAWVLSRDNFDFTDSNVDVSSAWMHGSSANHVLMALNLCMNE